MSASLSKSEAWERGPWCTKCAFPGAITAQSLDPAHPLGQCGRGTEDRPGCGRVILTTSLAEREAVFSSRRRKLTTAKHAKHDSAKYPVPYCGRCELEVGQLVTRPG